MSMTFVFTHIVHSVRPFLFHSYDAVGVKSVNKAMSKRGSVLLTLKVRESCEKRSDSNCLYDDLKEQTSPWNHHLFQLVKKIIKDFIFKKEKFETFQTISASKG